jgi:hypothetical protein
MSFKLPIHPNENPKIVKKNSIGKIILATFCDEIIRDRGGIKIDIKRIKEIEKNAHDVISCKVFNSPVVLVITQIEKANIPPAKGFKRDFVVFLLLFILILTRLDHNVHTDGIFSVS